MRRAALRPACSARLQRSAHVHSSQLTRCAGPTCLAERARERVCRPRFRAALASGLLPRRASTPPLTRALALYPAHARHAGRRRISW